MFRRLNSLRRWLWRKELWCEDDPDHYDLTIMNIVYVCKGWHPPVIWIGKLCLCVDLDPPHQRLPTIRIDWNPT